MYLEAKIDYIVLLYIFYIRHCVPTYM